MRATRSNAKLTHFWLTRHKRRRKRPEDDVNGGELLDLEAHAENRARFARRALFDRVARLLFEDDGELSPEVRTLIDEILIGLIDHVESEVRQKLSARIATLKSAPSALTKLLANDVIEIARPILHHSPVLTEEDLLDVIGARTTDHRAAIARRVKVPADVSAALAAAKESKVVEALLANLGAVIPRTVFGDLVALSEAVESIRKPLVARRDMPKDLAHRMFWFVSAALRQTILERFAVDARELDAMLAEMLVERQAETAMRPLVRRTTGEVNALMAKVRAGDIAGFTTTLAQLIGVDQPVAAKIVADKGGEALAIACKALGVDRSQFTTIFLQLDYKRFGRPRPIAHVHTVSKIYDLMTPDRARAQVSLWNAQNSGAALAA
jgi:uncharacterized protein (DUF2336 family)